MRFPYREYLATIPGTHDYRLIVRPVITIRIVGPRSDARWDALVDTGADETLFPFSLAALLGVEFDPHQTGIAAGISGDQLAIRYGDVEFRIETGAEIVHWKTTVGFVDFGSSSEEMIILGHAGCLEYFTATFVGESAELELVPNAILPTTATD
jgi:hypothetical protein